MNANHEKELESVRTECEELKQLAEERIRIELKVSLLSYIMLDVRFQDLLQRFEY